MRRSGTILIVSLVSGALIGLLYSFIAELHGVIASPALKLTIPSTLGAVTAIVLYFSLNAFRKRLRDEINRKEPFYRRLVENISDIIFSVNASGVITYISPVIKDLSGYESCQLINQPVTVLVHPEDLGPFSDSLVKTFAGITDPLVFRLSSRHGNTVWVRSLSKPVRDSFGTVIGLQGVITEQTRQTENEMLLAQMENNFRTIFNATSDMIIIRDMQGTIIEANKTAQELLEIPREKLIGTDISLLYPPGKQPLIETILFTPEKVAGARYDTCFISSSGKELPVEIYTRPLRYDNVDAVICSARDISALTALYRERERIKKFESIELLAAGIAHDFNNLLMAIAGNLTLCGSIAADEANTQHRDLVGDALAAVERMKNLTSQLLSFSGQGGMERIPVTMENFIANLRTSLEVNLPINLSITRDNLPEQLVFDPRQILAAIENLVENAVQAIKGAGDIHVHFSMIDNGSFTGMGKELPFMISVSDTGQGIAPENIDSIFDPFFTTYAERSGLGLATVYAIVKRHEGTITVTSTEKGTGFTVTIPQ